MAINLFRAGIVVLFSSLLIFSVVPIHNSEGQSSSGKNWERAAFDDNNSSFNPQTQITKDNLQILQVKWAYHIPPSPYAGQLGTLAGVRTRPLVIDGIVYIATAYNRLTALEAETGKVVWSFQPNLTALTSKPYVGNVIDVHHITSYGGIIYFQAADCTIFGLDAKQGTVKLTIPEACKDIPGAPDYRFQGRTSPVIYEKEGVLILGSAGVTTTPSGGRAHNRGFVAAYSTTTSNLLWRWFIIPPLGGDPDWDSKYVIQKGDGSIVTGTPKGNVPPYKGDWGNTDKIVGGATWSLMLMDQETGIVYVATGYPGEGLDAKLIPGPNLYASSLVALRATTGEMLWYYQLTPHAIILGDTAFQCCLLAKIEIGGKPVKAVFLGSRNGYAYAFDAEKGTPLWEPVKLGLHLNNINSNAGAAADMQIGQKDLLGKTICPTIGVYAPPAFAYNTFYVTAQNACGTFVSSGPDRYSTSQVGPINSTLYALDASTGKIGWQFFMPTQYQGASLTVSGGVVYAVDRGGTFYALDADTGKPLKTMGLGGLGRTGVGIGADKKGNMMLFVTSGGSGLGGAGSVTTGIVMAYGLPDKLPEPQVITKEVIKEVPKEVIKEVPKEVIKTVTVETVSPISYAAIGIGVVLVIISGVLFSRRKKA